MPDAPHLRKMAETCRNLAGTPMEPAVREALIKIAAEYDQRAERLDKRATPRAD